MKNENIVAEVSIPIALQADTVLKVRMHIAPECKWARQNKELPNEILIYSAGDHQDLDSAFERDIDLVYVIDKVTDTCAWEDCGATCTMCGKKAFINASGRICCANKYGQPSGLRCCD